MHGLLVSRWLDREGHCVTVNGHRSLPNYPSFDAHGPSVTHLLLALTRGGRWFVSREHGAAGLR